LFVLPFQPHLQLAVELALIIDFIWKSLMIIQKTEKRGFLLFFKDVIYLFAIKNLLFRILKKPS